MNAVRFLLLAVLLTSTALAQTPQATPAPTGNQAALPIFRATLPGGTYEVAVRAIVAVTSHEYLVDGVARVTEVNIDTTGHLFARFYYIEPNTPNTSTAPLAIGGATIDAAQRLLKEAADKTGQDAWKKVVKNYPTTTHAHTVEYRLDSLDQLNKLYESAEQAFRTQRDTRLSIDQ
jgi:hypothetical protein